MNDKNRQEFITRIEKSSQNRTEKDILFLYNYLLPIEYFRNLLETNELGSIIYKSILKNIQIKIYNQNTSVYKINDLVQDMFFVLEGELNQYYPISQYDCGTPRNLKLAEALKDNKRVQNVLQPGDLCGHLDFDRNKKRLYLVETKTKCILGFLSEANYKLIFNNPQSLEKQSIMNFLLNLKIFKDYNNYSMIDNLSNYAKRKQFKHNEVLINQGDKFEYIYIIVNGEFKIFYELKRFIKNKFNLDYFNTYGNSPNGIKNRTQLLKNQKNIQKKSNPANCERFTKMRNFELKDEYKEVLKYNLINYQGGEFLGDLEFKYNKNKYFFSAICESFHAEVLQFPLEDFEKVTLSSFHDILFKEIEWKEEYIEKRLKEISLFKFKSQFHYNKYENLILKKLNTALENSASQSKIDKDKNENKKLNEEKNNDIPKTNKKLLTARKDIIKSHNKNMSLMSINKSKPCLRSNIKKMHILQIKTNLLSLSNSNIKKKLFSDSPSKLNNKNFNMNTISNFDNLNSNINTTTNLYSNTMRNGKLNTRRNAVKRKTVKEINDFLFNTGNNREIYKSLGSDPSKFNDILMPAAFKRRRLFSPNQDACNKEKFMTNIFSAKEKDKEETVNIIGSKFKRKESRKIKFDRLYSLEPNEDKSKDGKTPCYYKRNENLHNCMSSDFLSQRVWSDNNNNFSKCLDINKQLFLNNDTATIKNKIRSHFLNSKL